MFDGGAVAGAGLVRTLIPLGGGARINQVGKQIERLLFGELRGFGELGAVEFASIHRLLGACGRLPFGAGLRRILRRGVLRFRLIRRLGLGSMIPVVLVLR